MERTELVVIGVVVAAVTLSGLMMYSRRTMTGPTENDVVDTPTDVGATTAAREGAGFGIVESSRASGSRQLPGASHEKAQGDGASSGTGRAGWLAQTGPAPAGDARRRSVPVRLPAPKSAGGENSGGLNVASNVAGGNRLPQPNVRGAAAPGNQQLVPVSPDQAAQEKETGK